MKRILLIGVAVIAVILLSVVGFAATRPDTFVVQRSRKITAPPEKIYPLLSNFHRWKAWSPYEKLDPAMQRTFSGEQEGKGAIYAWQGNSDAGKGQMTITNVVADERVSIELKFTEPFECQNVVDFTLKPAGESTEVTWAMQGKQTLMCKVMCLFMDMDTMIGSQFEEGLSNLEVAAKN